MNKEFWNHIVAILLGVFGGLVLVEWLYIKNYICPKCKKKVKK